MEPAKTANLQSAPNTALSAVSNNEKSGITVASSVTFNWCAEAESGTGNRPADNVSGASGGQAVGGFGNSSEYKEYSVPGVPGAGTYTLSLYYCSGEGTAQFGIVVNSTLQTTSALRKQQLLRAIPAKNRFSKSR